MDALKTIIPQETIWGSRLHPVIDRLYIAGYRAFVREGSLIVRKPNGETYMTNPYSGTCTCPARKRCKHSDSLVSLVFLSASELAYRGKREEADTLLEYWTQYCFWLGRNGQ